MLLIKRIKEIVENSREIYFKEHFYEKAQERPISEKLVKESLKKIERILYVEEQKAQRQNEEKYKVWIKLSNRYNLVVIVTHSSEGLYIITAWNTERKWQKKQK